MIEYLQSPVEAPPPDGALTIFLAGGALDPWRAELADRFAARPEPVRLLDPINFAWHRDDVRRRVDWEVRHLARADEVVAWFPATDSPDVLRHSPTTMFEVGRMRVAKPRVHVGVAPGHPRRAELAALLAAADVPAVDSLDALAAAVFSPARPLPPLPPAFTAFAFSADAVRFADLFALGVAVEQGGPLTVAVAEASPLRRELVAQLAVLRPSLTMG